MSGRRNKQSSGATGATSTKQREEKSTRSRSIMDPILGGELKTLTRVLKASMAKQLDASPSTKVSLTWMGLEDRIDGERGTTESPPPHPYETTQRREVVPSPWLLWSGDRVEEGPLALTLSSLESHRKVANEGQETETAISEALPLITNPMEGFDQQGMQAEEEPESTDRDQVRRRLALDEEDQEEGETAEPSALSSSLSDEPYRGSPSRRHRYTEQRPHSVQKATSNKGEDPTYVVNSLGVFKPMKVVLKGERLKEEQQKDPFLSKVIAFLENKFDFNDSEAKMVSGMANQFTISNGYLYFLHMERFKPLQKRLCYSRHVAI